MQVIVHQWAFGGSFEQLMALPRQELVNDWYGADVEPAAEFCFATDAEWLWFLAARDKAPVIHPDARAGEFLPELWKYDLAEFFIAAPQRTNYWEFNLAPNGAWWACAFENVRRADAALPPPLSVETQSIMTDAGWLVMARIALKELQGVDIRDCKLASTFILDTPEQVFLTSCDQLQGEPDFHRPQDFGVALLK